MKDFLTLNGYQVNDATSFTEETKAAVIDFQKKNGLEGDGIVEYHTWEALLTSRKPAGDKLTDEDFKLVAELLDCEPATIKAMHAVETKGLKAFFAKGKPTISFESNVFWSQLKKKAIDPNRYLPGNEDILSPKPEPGRKKTITGEYERLERARKINREAADAAASWGCFKWQVSTSRPVERRTWKTS